MYCEKCGKEIPTENGNICPNCNTNNNVPNTSCSNNKSFMPCFILGLIAGIFGILGGLCITMCYGVGSFTQTGNFLSGMAALFILGGSILGLVGACQSLKKLKIGAAMQLIAGILIMICVLGFTGADFMTLLAMILFIVSGIFGLFHSLKQ